MATSGTYRRVSVLFVGGDRDQLAAYAVASVKAGFAVDVAFSDVDAIAKAQAARPDMILLDVGGAEIDGIQVLRALKALSITRSIPVVLLTEETPLPGCTAALTKPFPMEELINVISIAASSRRRALAAS